MVRSIRKSVRYRYKLSLNNKVSSFMEFYFSLDHLLTIYSVCKKQQTTKTTSNSVENKSLWRVLLIPKKNPLVPKNLRLKRFFPIKSKMAPRKIQVWAIILLGQSIVINGSWPLEGKGWSLFAECGNLKQTECKCALVVVCFPSQKKARNIFVLKVQSNTKGSHCEICLAQRSDSS